MTKKITKFLILTTLLLAFSSPAIAQSSQNADLGAGGEHFKKGEYDKAFPLLKAKAEQGLAEAQYTIGWMYQLGKGTAQNKDVATEWYIKAAQQGHLSAQNNLCAIYLDVQKFSDAVSWCEKAANQSHPKAQFLLAMMYYNGHGVAKDVSQSVNWLLKSAGQGYAAAEYKLGHFYKSGAGVPQDLAEAKKYFERAASKNYKNAADFRTCIDQMKVSLTACDSLTVY